MKFLPLAHTGAIAIALLASAVAGADDRDANGNMKPSKILQVLLSDSDKSFFETANSANMFELEASKLAEQRATNPADKAFAKQMLKDHGKAGKELAALAKKKQVTLSNVLLKRHQMLFDEVATDSKDPDIKAFAAKTLPTLKAHGGMAEELPKKG